MMARKNKPSTNDDLDLYLASGGKLSDWIVPSIGKRLADMTFAEVAQAREYFRQKGDDAKVKDRLLTAYQRIDPQKIS